MTNRNTRECYQLWANGNSLNGWRFKMKSKAIFARRSDAEAHEPEFRAACCDRNHFECADPDGLEIEVVVFDFYD